MVREHLVSASITDGLECICNPGVLLGTKYGLWDFENEVAPKGTLLDLNAAWELFLSKRDFDLDVTFREDYHHLHEVIDGVTYEDGDTTYTLMDGDTPTQATFTIKANKGPVEHIEWQNGKLYLYYTKTRPITTEEKNDLDLPVHYVLDANDQRIIDLETGEYLIYDYVVIPVIEIFDNDETHNLFPWFADSLHTIRLRQTLDDPNDPNNSHLGDVAITSESEVFVAKERFPQNTGNTLVSILSLYELLKIDLGITPSYTNILEIVSGTTLTEGQVNLVNLELGTEYEAGDNISLEDATAYNETLIIDEEGSSIHQRATGSNRDSVLNTVNTSSVVAAINEDKFRTEQNTQLISGSTITPSTNWATFLQFSLNIPNNIHNLLAALNWIQDSEIGPFKTNLNTFIVKTVNEEDVSVENITEALNSIFEEAEANRTRIGYDRINKLWVTLNTDSTDTLTNAINEVDQHTNELANRVGLQEVVVNGTTQYSSLNLNLITKNRVISDTGALNKITVLESINELQSLIGNLDSGRSRISTWPELTTDNKNTLVLSINEVDLHADNNNTAIGGVYTTDANGVKNGNISNLNTTAKETIVAAINELDSRLGILDNLDTEDLENLVDAINEVVTEQPFIYLDPANIDSSGVVLKRIEEEYEIGEKENTAGSNSLALGTNVEVGVNSLGSGKDNILGDYGTISGLNNASQGNYNNIGGLSNRVKGNNNLVYGQGLQVNANNSTVLGKSNIVGNTELNTSNTNVTVIGKDLEIKPEVENSANIGFLSQIKGSNSFNLGTNNVIEENSVSIGHRNSTQGNKNYAIGDSNTIGCENSYAIGYNNTVNGGNEVFILGNSNNVHKNQYNDPANSNIVIGKNQNINGGNNNIVIGNTSKQYNNINNSIILGEFESPKNNTTNIGGEIQIQTHGTESNLLSLIFVDLNDWCKDHASTNLNGEKFLNTAAVVSAIREYKNEIKYSYTDRGLLRFRMLDNNQNGFIILQGDSTTVLLNGVTYYSNTNERGWSRYQGEYLKVVSANTTNELGQSITKHYLVLKDLLTTQDALDVDPISLKVKEGALRSSNDDDFGAIDLTHAYGAVDIDNIGDALDLTNRLNSKVDKTAKIITVARTSNGDIIQRPLNFVDLNDSSKSADIVLDLRDSFGFDKDDYLLLSEKGRAWGYAPLDGSGKIDAAYLPSYVDDVIDVWATYERDDSTGDIANLVLYEIVYTINANQQRVPSRGQVITQGEIGKIYIEAEPESSRPSGFENTMSHQFRWTGTQFVTIGASLVLGLATGTAYDGGRGRALEESVAGHINSGTTYIPSINNDGTPKLDNNGAQIYEVYNPNPHNVKPEHIKDVKIHDINYKIYHPDAEELLPGDNDYVVFNSLLDSLLEVFDRLDNTEDDVATAMSAIGSPLDFDDLNALDESTDNGFDGPTVIRTLLDVKEDLDSTIPLSANQILSIVELSFKLLGDTQEEENDPGNNENTGG